MLLVLSISLTYRRKIKQISFVIAQQASVLLLAAIIKDTFSKGIKKYDFVPLKVLARMEEEGARLKRRLGLFSSVNVIVAVMIGSGIFVSPSSALKYSGSVGMAIVVWVSCGIVCCLGK